MGGQQAGKKRVVEEKGGGGRLDRGKVVNCRTEMLSARAA